MRRARTGFGIVARVPTLGMTQFLNVRFRTVVFMGSIRMNLFTGDRRGHAEGVGDEQA